MPFLLPIASFALAILLGSFILWFAGRASSGLDYVDVLFTATSAVCITGLASVDIGTAFNSAGHVTILVLIQLGGLGITTYSTLFFFLVSKRVSLLNRLSVSEALLNDPAFHLGGFLKRVVAIVLALELVGAALVFAFSPPDISWFNSFFLAVSAFCNAGFSLLPDNFVALQQNIGVNFVVIFLIVSGGVGFIVLDELLRKFGCLIRFIKAPSLSGLKEVFRFSRYAKLIFQTTLFLILAGALVIFFAEYFGNASDGSSFSQMLLPSLFQSVTARTAGFNSMNIGSLTDVSLLLLILLMVIGGAPGSCAGGMKITTFRVLIAFMLSQLRGRAQVLIGGRAVGAKTLNKVFILLTFSVIAIISATFILLLTEGGENPHGQTPFQALDLAFEAVSAFSTVGLSTGVTPSLSTAGKLLECILMFVGRLGPIWLITAIQQFQTEKCYKYPEVGLPIGQNL